MALRLALAKLLLVVALALFPSASVWAYDCPAGTIAMEELDSENFAVRVCIHKPDKKMQAVDWALENKTGSELEVTLVKQYKMSCGNTIERAINRPIHFDPGQTQWGASLGGTDPSLNDLFFDGDCNQEFKVIQVAFSGMQVKKLTPEPTSEPAQLVKKPAEPQYGGLFGRLAKKEVRDPKPKMALPKNSPTPPVAAAAPVAKPTSHASNGSVRKRSRFQRGPGDTWRVSFSAGAGFSILPVYSHTYGEVDYDTFAPKPVGGFSTTLAFDWWPMYWRYFGVGMQLEGSFGALLGYNYFFGGGLNTYIGNRPKMSFALDLHRLWQGALSRDQQVDNPYATQFVASDPFMHDVWRVAPGLALCVSRRKETCTSALTFSYLHDVVVDYGTGHGFRIHWDAGFLDIVAQAWPDYPVGNREEESSWKLDFAVAYSFTRLGNQ